LLLISSGSKEGLLALEKSFSAFFVLYLSCFFLLNSTFSHIGSLMYFISSLLNCFEIQLFFIILDKMLDSFDLINKNVRADFDIN
jgi:hypothetical protein